MKKFLCLIGLHKRCLCIDTETLHPYGRNFLYAFIWCKHCRKVIKEFDFDVKNN